MHLPDVGSDQPSNRSKKKLSNFCVSFSVVTVMPRGQGRKKGEGDGGSVVQKRTHGSLPDTVRATKSSTPVASGTTDEKGRDVQLSADCSHFLRFLGGFACVSCLGHGLSQTLSQTHTHTNRARSVSVHSKLVLQVDGNRWGQSILSQSWVLSSFCKILI